MIFHTLLERVKRIELLSEHWKCPIITIILYSQECVSSLVLHLSVNYYLESRFLEVSEYYYSAPQLLYLNVKRLIVSRASLELATS